MAERRMFAKTIIDSDAFLDMPLSAQSLYFHLAMRADDEGFVNNPKKIQRVIGASDDDCKLLIMKRFILTFETGVIVIKHWKIHNYIRNDRFKETVYKHEKSLLQLNENNAYTEVSNVGIPNDNQASYQMDTQVRIGKDSIGKDSIGKNNQSSSHAREIPMNPTSIAIRKFFEEFGIIGYPNTDMQAFTLENIPILTDKFRRISWLGDKPHDSKWIAERIEQIINGCYDYSIDRDYTVYQEVDENGELKDVVSYTPIVKSKKGKEEQPKENRRIQGVLYIE